MLKLEEWPVKVRPKLMERGNKPLEKLVNGFQNIKEITNETIYRSKRVERPRQLIIVFRRYKM